jgi:hypothetical protein
VSPFSLVKYAPANEDTSPALRWPSFQSFPETANTLAKTVPIYPNMQSSRRELQISAHQLQQGDGRQPDSPWGIDKR